MVPYIIVLFTVILLAFVAQRSRNKALYNLYISLIFLTLVLFSGLRDRSVGTDTGMYVGRFLRLNSDIASLINSSSRIEIGYRFLELLAYKISDNYISLLLFIAFVTLYFQIRGIYRLSVDPLISIFVLITFGIYTYVFNGARQAIAAAIYLYALYYLVKGNFKKYLLWILLAFLFHKSVVLMIPLYFLFRKKFSFKLVALIAVAVILIVMFFQKIVSYGSIINENYGAYQNIEEQGGKYLTLAYVLLSSFFIAIRNRIKLNFIKNYDIYLNMFLLGTVVFVVVLITDSYIEITRIAFYFIISSIFIWPIIFKSLKQNEILLILVFFIFIHLAYFYIFLSRMSGLEPYIFNTHFF